ncbi:hypothetical protein WICMUC_003312 [Wickerhamomyces mucosus]|uniref:Uncharacterized protein n=1 Tax=Wickerhamomyces mucosus TaxID=1378264 RepID=A0A9P8PNJ3_9ASCO|nr:hypothetical protein WICMUC_003312 [Wickerhamomyces mucosus]
MPELMLAPPAGLTASMAPETVATVAAVAAPTTPAVVSSLFDAEFEDFLSSVTFLSFFLNNPNKPDLLLFCFSFFGVVSLPFTAGGLVASVLLDNSEILKELFLLETESVVFNPVVVSTGTGNADLALVDSTFGMDEAILIGTAATTGTVE